MTRSSLFGWIATFVIAGAFSTGILTSPTRVSAADDVSLALDWIVNGAHAGYFVALDKGWYEDQGLNVSISRGYGSGDTVKRIGIGEATFGVVDTGAMIAGRSQGVPVKALYMVYGQAALGLIYLEESGIKEPKDLEGRKIARSAKGASVVMFPGFLAVNDIDRSKIEEIVVDGATFLPLLLTREVDAVLEQSLHVGRFQAQADQQGYTVKPMRYSDFGLVAYGNAVIANDDTLESKPDVIRRFLCATDKGFKWAFEHEEEALEIIRKRHPEVELEWGVEELKGVEEIAWSPEAKEHGLGWIEQEKMQSTVDTVTNALDLPQKPQVEEIYTPQFHPANGTCE